MVNDPNESKRPSMSGSVYPVSPALSEFMALGLKGLPSGSRSGWGVEERKPCASLNAASSSFSLFRCFLKND